MENEYEDETDEIIEKLKDEVESWKSKYKALELKKRESDLSLNKIKTEINSLRSVDKQWKDSAKFVFTNLSDVKQQFDIQISQIVDGMSGISKAGERITAKIPYNKKLKSAIAQLQSRIAVQEESIMSLNGKIRILTSELQDKTKKVERLSQGIEEEVDRLIRPLREKLADTMVLVMKEKAARAQDRREIADLWPVDHLLPSVLMRYRSLTTEERDRRVFLSQQQSASYALTLEVRANVVESRSWEVKYDDYGRPFHQHVRTAEVSWEPPAILNYKPPPGRDEMGNVIATEETDMNNWVMKTDNRGQVFYEQIRRPVAVAPQGEDGEEAAEHRDIAEIAAAVTADLTPPVTTYIPPSAYCTVPTGKTKEVLVGEAASLVLSYIKDKISKHIRVTQKRKEALEHPLTFEEQRRKAKEDRNKSAEEKAQEEAEGREDEDDLDLSEFQYDIETVEMLAGSLSDMVNKANADKDPEVIRAEKRAFLADSAVRSFDADLFLGKTVAEVDVGEMDIPRLRGIVEELALLEEKLEKQVDRVRGNLKDFSFVLMDKIAAHNVELAKQQRLEAELRERERKAQLKAFRLEQKKVLAERREKKKLLLQESAVQKQLSQVIPVQDGLGRESSQRLVSVVSDNVLDTAPDVVYNAGAQQTDTQPSREEAVESPDETSDRVVQSEGVDGVGFGDGGEEAGEAAVDDNNGTDVVLSAAGLDSDDEFERELNRATEEDDKAESAALLEEEEAQSRPVDHGSMLFGDPVLLSTEPDCAPELIQMCADLVNFALFCGFSNLHPEQSPHDSNLEYSLQVDHQRLPVAVVCPAPVSDPPVSRRSTGRSSLLTHSARQKSDSAVISGESRDDEWLSCTFFLSVSKVALDQRRKVLAKTYSSCEGVLPIGPLDSEALVFSCLEPEGLTFERKSDLPYTPGTKRFQSSVRSQFEFWKASQLMSDVVVGQLQREAVAEALAHRMAAFQPPGHSADLPLSSSEYFNSRVKMASLSVCRVTFDKAVRFTVVTENLYFVHVSLGDWSARTHSLAPSPHQLVWEDFPRALSSSVPVNDAQVLDLCVEVLDDNPQQPDQFFVGRGKINVNRLLGHNLGRELVFSCELHGADPSVVAGVLTITLSLDFDNSSGSFVPAEASHDPQSLNHLEVLRTPSRDTPLGMQSDSLSVVSTAEAERSRNQFISLVSDLRGDGVNFVRQLIGDVSLKDVSRVGRDVGSSSVKALPDFVRATSYLRRKTNVHRWEVDALAAATEQFYGELDVFLARKEEVALKQSNEMRARYKKLVEGAEDLKKEVLRVQKVVSDTRKPHPSPKEPVMAELPPVQYVPKLPVTGALDNRGKKKKQIPANDLKVLLERVENGELDGIDIWPYPDSNWPSQAQQLKLGKALASRNAILDAKRDQELESRVRQTEVYQGEMAKWESLERRRNVDLDKAKRDCRKINLRFEYHMERTNRVQKEFQALEGNYNFVRELAKLHLKSKNRFKTMRFKQFLEFNRQQSLLENLKKRLLRALKARRHAMELPSSATDEQQFERLSRQSEEALRIIKFEVFECKQQLLEEGIRLRTLFQEERVLCQSELARVKVSREILNQRECFDKILERYKYEVLALMQDMEKLRIAESEKDEVGVDTVDDLGEKYVQGKVWLSPEISKCQRLVDICMAKINLTEGLGNSTIESQRATLEVLTTKWGSDFLALRDSWSEHSDYERAQQLLSDTVQYLANERVKLVASQRAVDKEKTDLQQQLIAMREQRHLVVHTHELETSTINRSSTDVISVMRNHLDSFRQECRGKIDHLESSIVDLSRECQKVREELLAQEMLFDEKVKVLWAFIHTLQTAVQQLSVRMEMVLEEREQIVIQSKLVADKMRHQLRIERNHCSNLMFIIHSQRGFVRYLQDVIRKLSVESMRYENEQKIEKSNLRREIWEQLFCFTRLCTDVDALFEFFAARLANLAGSRSSINNALARNNAAMVLAALCKSPRPLIRKCAARALGGMGWDGFVETRILLWDCVMYWKVFRSSTLAKEAGEFKTSFAKFDESGQYESILNIAGEVEEFVPSGNMSLRTIIKQRRQWALRAARRSEGPNVANQRLINIKDGVIPSLLDMSLRDGEVDWEIARNAALAISIASYEPNNHHDMTHNDLYVQMIIRMCRRVDAEVQTHAAVTVANLCHRDEAAQLLFGKAGAIEALIGMLSSGIVDVLEAATSALSNITCYCDVNCQEVIRLDGVGQMIRIITHALSENLLDLDQNDEVQANAAEMLANVSRFSTDDTVGNFNEPVVDALVLMCASQNKQLRRHIPLVLGNIAQSESCRFTVGVKGGIEALFLVLEDSDTTIQANALWALCNLMWHPPNQERAGRFMSEVIAFLSSEWEPVRTHSATLLANVLYYNSTNRVRFLEHEGAMELILGFVRQKKDMPVVEGSLRALLSLSYLDSVAMWLGVEAHTIPMFIAFLTAPLYSRESMRYSLEILCNLCLHHSNRRIIYDNGGIEAIVALHIDNHPHIRELSVHIVEHLEDITPAEVLARVKVEIGLERMVTLATSADPLVRAVAAESIGEEIWADPKKQQQAHRIGGVDALLGIVANDGEPVESVLPALWSLRNILQHNADAQSQFRFRDGLSVVSALMRRAFSGCFEAQTEKIFEAGLICLQAATLDNERNSRKLLMVGLDVVMDLAEGQRSGSVSVVGSAMKSEGVIALAKSLLLMLGPYNYVVCKNCQRKQILHGTSCFNCGYRLLVEVDAADAAHLKELAKLPAKNPIDPPTAHLRGSASVKLASKSARSPPKSRQLHSSASHPLLTMPPAVEGGGQQAVDEHKETAAAYVAEQSGVHAAKSSRNQSRINSRTNLR